MPVLITWPRLFFNTYLHGLQIHIGSTGNQGAVLQKAAFRFGILKAYISKLSDLLYMLSCKL